MSLTHKTSTLALAAVFALSAGAAMARDDMKPAKVEMEKCYGVAKAGVIQYTRCLAAQLRPHGISVNAVAPGMIKSGRFLATLKHREGAAELLNEKRPLVRLGEPDDVARVVEFFVTDLSEYVTGQVLRVDGGMQLFAG